MGIGILTGFGVKTYIRSRSGVGTVSNPLITELEGLVSDIKNILAESTGITASGDPIVRVPSINFTSGSGSVAAGAKSVAISNTGSANGLILGQPIPPGMAVGFDGAADILAAISYNATGTTFMIIEVR